MVGVAPSQTAWLVLRGCKRVAWLRLSTPFAHEFPCLATVFLCRSPTASCWSFAHGFPCPATGFWCRSTLAWCAQPPASSRHFGKSVFVDCSVAKVPEIPATDGKTHLHDSLTTMLRQGSFVGGWFEAHPLNIFFAPLLPSLDHLARSLSASVLIISSLL
jgi:hypothetical protein